VEKGFLDSGVILVTALKVAWGRKLMEGQGCRRGKCNKGQDSLRDVPVS